MSNLNNKKDNLYKQPYRNNQISSKQKLKNKNNEYSRLIDTNINQTPKIFTKNLMGYKIPLVQNEDTDDSKYSLFKIKDQQQDNKGIHRHLKNKTVRYNPDLSFRNQQFISSKRINLQTEKYRHNIDNLKQTDFKVKQKGSMNSSYKYVDNNNCNVTFQSARIDSIKCLNHISAKLKEQINTIENKLQVFNNKMYKIINAQFNKLKDRINETIEKVFRQNQTNINKYMKVQQSILAGQLIQAKQNLENQYNKIQAMKQQMNKTGWRKIAGQLIANDIVDKIQAIIQETRLIDIGYWESLDLGNKKFKQLEQQLKQIINIIKIKN